MLMPKPTKMLFVVCMGLVIGGVITIVCGLVWTAPWPRLIIGLSVAAIVIAVNTRQITQKNLHRLRALLRVVSTNYTIQAARKTTNSAKPGKVIKVFTPAASVEIPEKRWRKIAPVLNVQTIEL